MGLLARGAAEPSKWREQGKGVFLYTDYIGVACMVDYKATNAENAGFLLEGVIDASDTTRYGNPSLID